MLAEKVLSPDLFSDPAAGSDSLLSTTDEAAVKVKPRRGSRMDRLMQPQLRQVARGWAQVKGVCERPTPIRQIDTLTGGTVVVDVPCNARLASKCKSCAERNRRLRQQQIRDGWHLEEEPMPGRTRCWRYQPRRDRGCRRPGKPGRKSCRASEFVAMC
jgi:Replication initiator protein, pSAM2